MKLFGKEILVRKYSCTENGVCGDRIKPSVKIYAKVTNGCNAGCGFCSNFAHKERIEFDICKFIEIVRVVEASRINLQRVCITGGEPSCASETVEAILEEMSSDSLRDVPVYLSTNGISDRARELMRNPRLNCVTMSLHHYDNMKLAEIYGVHFPIKSFSDVGVESSKFTVSCNLMKGYIDSAPEVKKMMDYALDIGCGELGFVSLLDKNEFCRKHFVSIDDIKADSVDHLNLVMRHECDAGCKCRNYLYASGKLTLPVYFRGVSNSENCESTLLFDGEHLRQGFGSENIIY